MPQRFITEDRALLFAGAMRGVRARGYTGEDLRADLGAGLTLGVVALPLSMALAIASGAPPQLGLFTAIVGGGTVIALAGGSMHSVSGPTAAFVVLLAPIRVGLAGGGADLGAAHRRRRVGRWRTGRLSPRGIRCMLLERWEERLRDAQSVRGVDGCWRLG